MNFLVCINNKFEGKLRDEIYYQMSLNEDRNVIVTDFQTQKFFLPQKEQLLIELPNYLHGKNCFALLLNVPRKEERSVMKIDNLVQVVVDYPTLDPSKQFTDEMSLFYAAKAAQTQAEFVVAMSSVPVAAVIRKGDWYGINRIRDKPLLYSRNQQGGHTFCDRKEIVENHGTLIYINHEPTIIPTDTWEAIRVKV